MEDKTLRPPLTTVCPYYRVPGPYLIQKAPAHRTNQREKTKRQLFLDIQLAAARPRHLPRIYIRTASTLPSPARRAEGNSGYFRSVAKRSQKQITSNQATCNNMQHCKENSFIDRSPRALNLKEEKPVKRMLGIVRIYVSVNRGMILRQAGKPRKVQPSFKVHLRWSLQLAHVKLMKFYVANALEVEPLKSR